MPVVLKAGLSMAVAVMLMPHLELPQINVLDSPYVLVLGIVGEVIIGVMIGLATQLIFTGIQLAGQISGFQMGFALANVVDPASSLQIPLLAQFINLFALMIFFATNAHYYFIKALVDSFSLVPPMTAHFNAGLMPILTKMAGNAFVIAIKVGAPVIIALLLSNVALGLTARTVPQMQIFVVAMPLKILMGLFFLGISLPFMAAFFDHEFVQFGQNLIRLIALFR